MAVVSGETPILATKVGSQLTVNYRFIVENVSCVDSILDELISSRVLTIDDRQLVDSRDTAQGKVRKLLEILFPKPNNALVVFVDSLKPDNFHVYRKILATKVEGTTENIPSVVVKEPETLTVLLKIALTSALEEDQGSLLDLGDIRDHINHIKEQNNLPHDITQSDLKSAIKATFPYAVFQMVEGVTLTTRVKHLKWRNDTSDKSKTPTKLEISGTIDCLPTPELSPGTAPVIESSSESEEEEDVGDDVVGDVNTVSYVLSQDGGRYTQSRLRAAAEANRIKEARALLKVCKDLDDSDEFGRTALYVACREGHIGTVRLLVGKGAGLERRAILDATPLIAACVNSKRQVAQYLVEQGACVNAANRLGVTPLMYAVFQPPDPVLAEFLINNDANVNHTDHSDVTALMSTLCMEKPCSVTLKLLIAHGANVNAQDKNGNTALHYVVRHKANMAVRTAVKLLLAYGANPNITNKQSCVVIDLVHGGVVAWLVKKMILKKKVKFHPH